MPHTQVKSNVLRGRKQVLRNNLIDKINALCTHRDCEDPTGISFYIEPKHILIGMYIHIQSSWENLAGNNTKGEYYNNLMDLLLEPTTEKHLPQPGLYATYDWNKHILDLDDMEGINNVQGKLYIDIDRMISMKKEFLRTSIDAYDASRANNQYILFVKSRKVYPGQLIPFTLQKIVSIGEEAPAYNDVYIFKSPECLTEINKGIQYHTVSTWPESPNIAPNSWELIIPTTMACIDVEAGTKWTRQ